MAAEGGWHLLFSCHRLSGFNEAAARWPRKAERMGMDWAVQLELQRGRGAMAAEGCQRCIHVESD